MVDILVVGQTLQSHPPQARQFRLAFLLPTFGGQDRPPHQPK